MHQTLVVDFTVQPAHADAFAAAIAENAGRSVADEAGCHQFDVCRDPADPAVFCLYEVYQDDAAIQAHMASPHFKTFDALTAPWVVAKTVRRFERAVP
ncbi:antibiotic biosynthesis monooxygenase [Xylophilus sp. Kf1]|nr:antibiotic biosynthesis monooxygenase [Xylophilus sp. Kf1]